MASSKSFFGKRRGSTKNFTFTVFNGKQVTKEKAEQVKNPRTLAQMRNRMVLTTSSAAYAAMKEIVDHSFQGYTYGLQNMSRFQSVNNKLLRENIAAVTPQFAYCEYGKAKLLPGAYIISQGSLNPIPTTKVKVNGDDDGHAIFGLSITDSDSSVTSNAVLQALGLAVDELATVCTIVPVSPDGTMFEFAFLRLKVFEASDTAITTSNIAEFISLESDHEISVSAVASGEISISLSVNGASRVGVVAVGVIHSALVNGSWKRSDAVMTVNLNSYELGPTPAEAIASYPIGGSYILNDGQINGGYNIEPSGGDDEPDPEP